MPDAPKAARPLRWTVCSARAAFAAPLPKALGCGEYTLAIHSKSDLIATNAWLWVSGTSGLLAYFCQLFANRYFGPLPLGLSSLMLQGALLVMASLAIAGWGVSYFFIRCDACNERLSFKGYTTGKFPGTSAFSVIRNGSIQCGSCGTIFEVSRNAT